MVLSFVAKASAAVLVVGAIDALACAHPECDHAPRGPVIEAEAPGLPFLILPPLLPFLPPLILPGLPSISFRAELPSPPCIHLHEDDEDERPCPTPCPPAEAATKKESKSLDTQIGLGFFAGSFRCLDRSHSETYARSDEYGGDVKAVFPSGFGGGIELAWGRRFGRPSSSVLSGKSGSTGTLQAWSVGGEVPVADPDAFAWSGTLARMEVFSLLASVRYHFFHGKVISPYVGVGGGLLRAYETVEGTLVRSDGSIVPGGRASFTNDATSVETHAFVGLAVPATGKARFSFELRWTNAPLRARAYAASGAEVRQPPVNLGGRTFRAGMSLYF